MVVKQTTLLLWTRLSLSHLLILAMQDLTVQILSDDFTEFNETFTAVLSSVFLADTAGGAAIELINRSRESSSDCKPRYCHY